MNSHYKNTQYPENIASLFAQMALMFSVKQVRLSLSKVELNLVIFEGVYFHF